MCKKKKLLIFILSYKASHRITEVYNKIPFEKLKKFDVKVLMSDDCSNDDTETYIKKLKNKKNFININKKNIGYGAHIKKCLNFALKKKFDYCVMIHGDGQYGPKYIPKLLSFFKNNSIDSIAAVTGSRLYNGLASVKRGNMPFYKMIGNILLTKFFNLLFNTKFTDAHTGLWLYNLDFLKNKKFEKLADNFNFDQEFRLLCIYKNMNVKEIYIQTKYGDERSQLHVIYAIRFFFKTILCFLIKKGLIKSKKFS